MAAIVDDLLASLEIGVEVALPADQGASVVVALVEDAGVAIVLPAFSIELNHIVLVVDRMDVVVVACGRRAAEDAIFASEDADFAFGAVHAWMSKYYN